MRRALLILVVSLVAVVQTAAAQEDRAPAPTDEAAQEFVAETVQLPLSGRTVQLHARHSGRIVIHGTVSSRLDGSLIDAVSRWDGSTQVIAGGPFVMLPAGSQIVESDPEIHRYEVQLPAATGSFDVSFNPAPIAARNLVTRSEAVRSLSGAIQIDVFGVRPLAETPHGPTHIAHPRTKTSLAVYVARAGALAFALALAFVLIRRRRHDEQELLARIRKAHVAIAREAKRLGPAFSSVEASSKELAAQATSLRALVKEVDAALERSKRFQGSSGAREQRDELQRTRVQSVERMHAITERLEEIATQLVAQVVGHAQPSGIEAALAGLRAEIDTAVDADHEAHAV